MPRFYCPQPLAEGALVDLPEAVAHHLRVLRLQAGDPLILFDGSGGEFLAELVSVDKKSVLARVTAFNLRDIELPYSLALAQALPEASKMDWIIEKAVELGVSAIVPLSAQRSVVRLAGDRADKRQAHWHKVIVAAAEQSGRNRLPALAPLASFKDWVVGGDGGTRILLSPRASQSLAAWARVTAPHFLTLMVGPEGGFSPEEEALALAQGALTLSMGPRVLRTETAGLAALATLNAHWAP
jgi:16S rRNA (uracil1498-N3)-methyltransferase